MSNEELTPGRHRGEDLPEHRPSLTIAEAAQAWGVSTSTIRRYLRAGRFPSARQEASPDPGQAGRWRIPADEVLDAGPDRRTPTPPDHGQGPPGSGDPVGGGAARDRIRVLEHALELERTRRQAAEDLAADRAHTIRMLETALAALERRHAGPGPDRPATAPSASSSAAVAAERPPRPAPPPGVLPMVPTPRRAKRELSQEERAAIIGRALSGPRPPKRRWWWQP
jgi:Helix-turn-helix domain